MSALPATLLATTGIIGGYATARFTENRPLGGAVLAAAGAGAFVLWQREAGTAKAIALSAAYIGAFGGSHPLAKRLGAWPSVLTVTAGVAAASLALGRRSA